ncbi:MAG: penicillin acylase family protein [Bryobacteraceae bacterium]|nr:penicillin acylase family protein [Bryobacteraceae bacterium]
MRHLLRRSVVLLAFPLALPSETVKLAGLGRPVEVLRDRWGVPHIYASSQRDLFFAQGYMAARDRLFQLDLCRRAGSGRMSEVLGPEYLRRDRLARLLRYRGDWSAEWPSYAPDARDIVSAFTAGINAYIKTLAGRRPREFVLAGFDPGLWQPEDVVSRLPAFEMLRNLTRELTRARLLGRYGARMLEERQPVDPWVKVEFPKGLSAEEIPPEIAEAISLPTVSADGELDGSNNWVLAGARTASGKPILANDPHRALLMPSLRKTVHLVAPGWNVIGAGEPALPGIALGHNEDIAFGFTIVGMDQQDLYVEKLNPANPNEYLFKGSWRRMEVVKESVMVRGGGPTEVELKYTLHGPVIYEDRGRRRAYALKWVGAEPGGAAYLPALSLARARNWPQFLAAVARYKTPSENLVYADRAGHIAWIAAGRMPVRPNWPGLLPVPGDAGEYEWSGYLTPSQLPQEFDPPRGYIATANHNILPPAYPHRLGHEFAPRFRFDRLEELLRHPRKLSVADVERLQTDVVSLPARRLQQVVRRWEKRPQEANSLLAWDCRMDAASAPALLYAVWVAKLPAAIFGLGPMPTLEVTLRALEANPAAHTGALARSFSEALVEIRRAYGSDAARWQWGALHKAMFRHPLGRPELHRGPVPTPGDAHTVNAAAGRQWQHTNGASYRQILDTADWDKSVMTNVPGESGDPDSRHYSDLLDDWAKGKYHPLPYSRKAVEAATVERITLTP